MKFFFSIITCFLFSLNIEAQSVAINTDGSTANPSALLDIKSTGKGVLVPRMNKAQKNAIAAPATGLLVFQDAPDSSGFYYFDGTAWLWLATATNALDWRTTGNAGTDTAVNFIGTTDNMPIRFKQNNNWIGQLNANNSNFFIGTNSGRNTTVSTNTALGANSLASNTSGVGNLAVGAAALTANSVGNRNTAIGDSAMFTQSFVNGNVSYDMDNTAVGSKSLFFNQPSTNANGYKNTAVGSEALYRNTTGFENTAVGTGAMHDNITGQQNTAVGRSAYRLSKSGDFNTYMGFEAGFSDSIANNSVGIGYRALINSVNGQNTAVGSAALSANTSGASNVSIGYVSLSSNTTGGLNTAIGMNSMFTNISGSNNVTVGALANVTASNLSNATAIGTRATVAQSNSLVLGSITGINGATVTPNVGIGTNAPNTSSSLDITSTSRGILIPRMSKAQKNAIATPATGLMVYQNAPDSAGFHYYDGAKWVWIVGNNTADTIAWNTIGNSGTDTARHFIGTKDNMPLRFKVNNNWAGQFNDSQGNFFIGTNAGRKNTSGIVNSGFGSGSLANNTTGSFNTAVGGALFSNTTGTQNTAVGTSSMANHKTGDNNVAMGNLALWQDTAGNNNTALGTFTLFEARNVFGNVAVGTSALGQNRNKPFKTAVGYNALNSDTSNATSTAVGASALESNRNGKGNTAVGGYALRSNTFSSQNTAVGDSALYSQSFFNAGTEYESHNTAVGAKALFSNQPTNAFDGANNTAVGSRAMYQNTLGQINDAFGTSALEKNSIGYSNTSIGAYTLFNLVKGHNNVAVGTSAGAATGVGGSDSVSFSTFVGNSAGAFNHRDRSVGIGYSALAFNGSGTTNLDEGKENTAVGFSAMQFFVRGSRNTALGHAALSGTPGPGSSGNNNVAVGDSALAKSFLASGNIAIGNRSLANNINAGQNVAIGDSAMHALSFNNGGAEYTTNNVGIGYKALFANNPTSIANGEDNTAVGALALSSNTIGDNNTAVGNQALASNTIGTNNTALGNLALNLNTSGFSNVAIGSNALEKARGANNFNVAVGVNALQNDSATTSGANTAIGFQAGMFNSGGRQNFFGGASAARELDNGSFNVAIGNAAMLNHTTGDSNTVVGASAMGINIGTKKGNYNTAIGFEALYTNDTSSNTAIGYRALRSVSTGADNTSLGFNSGNNLTTGFNNTFLGAQSQAALTSVTNATAVGYQSTVVQDNSLTLGSISGVNGASATVNVGVGTNTPDARMHIVRNGASGGTYQSESGLILENSSIFTLQFSTPNASPALIRSGNASTPQRSGITFEADSSINFNSGGSLNRMIIDNTGFVGVRTSAPASYLDVSGSVGNAISTSTVSVSLDQFDHTHIILPTAAAVTITLPAANTCPRREYVIVNQDNTVHNFSITYLDFSGAAVTTIPVNNSIIIQSNGTSWFRTR